MAHKKYTIQIGNGFGMRNVKLMEIFLRIFWDRLTNAEKETWKSNPISRHDKTGELTFISYFVQKYAKANSSHWDESLGKLKMKEDEKKVFNDRKDQELVKES